MSIRSLRYRDTSGEATFDLNIVPMMDMFVSIIPFLLLSATFLQVMLIDVPLPTPVAQALAEDRQGVNKEISIKVTMNHMSGFFIDIMDGGKRSANMAVPMLTGKFNFTGLHKKLIEVKQRFPKVFKLELNPDESIDYSAIVQVMDAARNVERADPKIMIDNAESPLMFPDVILANVMG